MPRNMAKPGTLSSRLEPAGDRYALSVRDDGIGFLLPGSHTGMGIRIMHYRARVIGATLSLQSQPGSGTHVTCLFLPVSRELFPGGENGEAGNDDGGRQRTTKDQFMSKTQPEKSRILIVDDHPLFREGLQQMIDRNPDLTVCGEAADAAEAMRAIAELKPDLVLVDISLGGSSGIDLIKNIKSKYDDLPMLVVSMHDESLYAERALRAGAMGYVMKHEPAKTVKAAISKVLGGDIYLSEQMSGSMLSKLMGGKGAQPVVTRRDVERPRTGGFSNARPGKGHAADCGGTEPDHPHHPFLPRPHQGKAPVENRHGSDAARHPMGSGRRRQVKPRCAVKFQSPVRGEF